MHNHFHTSMVELTWLQTARPYLTNVAKCSLLKFIKSYLNSWCKKVSERCLTVSCGDGTRLCLLLLTLIWVPGDTLISIMLCLQILVFFRTRLLFDFGTMYWRKLRPAFCVMFSSGRKHKDYINKNKSDIVKLFQYSFKEYSDKMHMLIC